MLFQSYDWKVERGRNKTKNKLRKKKEIRWAFRPRRFFCNNGSKEERSPNPGQYHGPWKFHGGTGHDSWKYGTGQSPELPDFDGLVIEIFSRSSRILRQFIVVVDLFRQLSRVIIKLLTPNHITRPYTTSKIYCVNSSIIFKERNQNYFANSAIWISTQILARKWWKRSKNSLKSQERTKSDIFKNKSRRYKFQNDESTKPHHNGRSNTLGHIENGNQFFLIIEQFSNWKFSRFSNIN